MNEACLICGSATEGKVPSLRELGYLLCSNHGCITAFLQNTRLELPVCLGCARFDAKKKSCSAVEANPYLQRIGGLDLKFLKFGLFCGDFAVKGRLKQAKLVREELGDSYG